MVLGAHSNYGIAPDNNKLIDWIKYSEMIVQEDLNEFVECY